MYSGLIAFSESALVNKQGNNERQILRPYIEASREGKVIKLTFDLDGEEGLLIFCRRAGEQHFSFVDEAYCSPFEDHRPNHTKYSEVREYKAYYIKDGETIGEPDFVKVKTKGKFRLF
jgi:hypothetical protein